MSQGRKHTLGNLIIILFLGLVFGSGVHSLWSRDSRLGWGMFSRDMEYVIAYWWISDDGVRVRYQPGSELRGKAVQLRPFHSAQAGLSSTRHIRYGMGTVTSWIRSYLRFLYQNKRPTSAVRIEARLYYSVNSPLLIDESAALAGQFTFYDPEKDKGASGKLLILNHPAPGDRP